MLLKPFKRSLKTPGQAPGSMIHVGEQKMLATKVTAIEYHRGTIFDERVTADLAFLQHVRESEPVTWINVAGLHEIETISRIGEIFDIHPLILEDILNTDQRPKLDQSETNIYLIVKMIQWQEDKQHLETEQVSIVLGPGFVLTFQEQEKDVFEPVRERLRSGKGQLRQRGADYLAYSLLDAVVDHYFVVLERLGEHIEEIEEKLIADPEPETLEDIHHLKREMLYLRRSVWPLRELIGGLQRGDLPQFRQETLIYLRDVYEHTIQVIDTIESFRDIVSGLLDIYLSSVSHRLNEVMKVLTIISTIFIPLTFITGLYGMNFTYIPELQVRWAYFAVWGVMITITGGLLIFFKRKKWL